MTSLLNEISALWNHFVDPPRELTLTELAEIDMPDSLRVRIVATVQHQARTATIQADSEWLDMNHPSVYIDWMNFVTDHLPYAKIPQAYVRTVFDSALEDLVECCVHPRTAIVDLCFGERTERSFAEVELASRAIPVHEDLVKAMITAVADPVEDSVAISDEMVQKNDAQAAIEKADIAMFEGLNGTELAELVVRTLEPLYELCKDSIDPTYLSTYLEEKGLDELASAVERTHEPLSREDFVEFVSEWEQMGDAAEEIESDSSEQVLSEQDADAADSQGEGFEKTDQAESMPEASKSGDYVDSPGSDELLGALDSDDSPDAPKVDTLAEHVAPQSEGVPLWMQYLEEVPEDEEETGDQLLPEEPSMNQSLPEATPETPLQPKPTPLSPTEQLIQHLKPIQPNTMKRLFEDDYGQYLDMIQNVSEFKDWKTASQWLDDHVFLPQEVDIEDEVVITFIDHMQAYFEK